MHAAYDPKTSSALRAAGSRAARIPWCLLCVANPHISRPVSSPTCSDPLLRQGWAWQSARARTCRRLRRPSAAGTAICSCAGSTSSSSSWRAAPSRTRSAVSRRVPRSEGVGLPSFFRECWEGGSVDGAGGKREGRCQAVRVVGSAVKDTQCSCKARSASGRLILDRTTR